MVSRGQSAGDGEKKAEPLTGGAGGRMRVMQDSPQTEETSGGGGRKGRRKRREPRRGSGAGEAEPGAGGPRKG